MKQKQRQQRSVWSPQKAAWGLCRCPLNSLPDTSLTHRQRTDIVLRGRRAAGLLHPELFLFLLTMGRGERNLGYKCFIKNNSKSKLSKYKSS